MQAPQAPALPVQYLNKRRFKILKKRDGKNFKQVFEAIDLGKNKKVIILLEEVLFPKPKLIKEAKFHQFFNQKSSPNKSGIPQTYYSFSQGKHHVAVMDCFGKSLETLLHEVGGKFSLKTVLMLMDQMIQRIQYVHSKNYLLLNARPESFYVGLNDDQTKLCIQDFDLVKQYRSAKGVHCRYSEGNRFLGVMRYASINSHQGVRESRRDDLEALGYIASYFLKGSLPWQVEKPITQQKYEKAVMKKMCTHASSLFVGFPEQFYKFIQEFKFLKFEQQPDYDRWRQTFRDIMKEKNYEYDYKFDWVVAKENKQNSQKAVEKQQIQIPKEISKE